MQDYSGLAAPESMEVILNWIEKLSPNRRKSWQWSIAMAAAQSQNHSHAHVNAAKPCKKSNKGKQACSTPSALSVDSARLYVEEEGTSAGESGSASGIGATWETIKTSLADLTISPTDVIYRKPEKPCWQIPEAKWTPLPELVSAQLQPTDISTTWNYDGDCLDISTRTPMLKLSQSGFNKRCKEKFDMLSDETDAIRPILEALVANQRKLSTCCGIPFV